MGKPLVLDLSLRWRRNRQESSIEKQLARYEKAWAPRGFRHAATAVRRKCHSRNCRNGFRHLRVAELIHRRRTVEEVAKLIGQAIGGQIDKRWRRNQLSLCGRLRSKLRLHRCKCRSRSAKLHKGAAIDIVTHECLHSLPMKKNRDDFGLSGYFG